MPDSDTILLSISAVLTAYLYIRYWRRARARPAERPWSGHGIDVSTVSERVHRTSAKGCLLLRDEQSAGCRIFGGGTRRVPVTWTMNRRPTSPSKISRAPRPLRECLM